MCLRWHFLRSYYFVVEVTFKSCKNDICYCRKQQEIKELVAACRLVNFYKKYLEILRCRFKKCIFYLILLGIPSSLILSCSRKNPNREWRVGRVENIQLFSQVSFALLYISKIEFESQWEHGCLLDMAKSLSTKAAKFWTLESFKSFPIFVSNGYPYVSGTRNKKSRTWYELIFFSRTKLDSVAR